LSTSFIEEGLIIKTRKYNTVMIWPVRIKGISTGWAPIQVRRITRFRITHSKVLLFG